MSGQHIGDNRELNRNLGNEKLGVQQDERNPGQGPTQEQLKNLGIDPANKLKPVDQDIRNLGQGQQDLQQGFKQQNQNQNQNKNQDQNQNQNIGQQNQPLLGAGGFESNKHSIDLSNPARARRDIGEQQPTGSSQAQTSKNI